MTRRKLFLALTVLCLSIFAFSLGGLGQEKKKYKFEWGDTIDQIEKKIKANAYNFTVKTNPLFVRLTKMDPKERKRFLTRRMPSPELARKTETGPGPLPEVMKKEAALPPSFDWRNHEGRSYITKMARRQGDCGSCYAFGATAAAEGAYNWQTRLADGKPAEFSEAFIAWCLGKMGAYSPHFSGCGGADYDYYELEALTKEGIIKEDDFPYTDKDPGPCKHMDKPRIVFKSWHRVDCEDVKAIKTAIRTYGVVDAAVDVTPAFAAYADGIYQDTNTGCDNKCAYVRTNHAIALVGWGQENGEEFFWLRNSWGPNWGIDGYMKIAVNAARVSCAVTYLVYK